jgi:hypothetical protein
MIVISQPKLRCGHHLRKDYSIDIGLVPVAYRITINSHRARPLAIHQACFRFVPVIKRH